MFLKRVSLLNPRVRTNFVAFPLERTRKGPRIAGVFKGATRLGATRPATLRGKWYSERVSERVSERALEKPLKTSETLPLRDPLRDPLRGRFPSQNLSDLLPLIVLPLDLSPIEVRFDFGPRPGFSKQLFGSSREGFKGNGRNTVS